MRNILTKIFALMAMSVMTLTVFADNVTVYDNYFYQIFATTNTSAEDMITNAGFPSYLTTTITNRGYGHPSLVSEVTTPYDFTTINTSDTYYYLKAGGAVTLTAVADVKAVHFYGYQRDGYTHHKISTTVTHESGEGSSFSVADLITSGAESAVQQIGDWVVYLSTTDGATARSEYAATGYYTYTFTLGGNFWLYGIYVEKNHVAPTSVTLNKTAITLLENGETDVLVATISPANTTVKTVTWTSSNTDVATVSADGIVTAKAAGSAVITASLEDESATCNVTVNACDQFIGTVYSMTPVASHREDLAAGTKIDFSEYATIVYGGRIWLGNVGTETVAGGYNQFGETSSGSGIWHWWLQHDDAYMNINMNCALRNGDTIICTSSDASTRELTFTTNNIRATTNKTSGGKYIVHAGDGLAGIDSIYVWRFSSNNAPRLRSIEIHRPASYTLTYNANGGEGAPAEEYLAPVAGTLSSVVPTREGYVFANWNTEEDGSGTKYAAGASFTMPEENITLYAQWGQVLYDNYFYKLYSTSNVEASALVSAAEFPSYMDVAAYTERAWGHPEHLSSVTTPHDFTSINLSDQYYYIKAGGTITLSKMADVKAVHFYGWSRYGDQDMNVTATIESVPGSNLANWNASLLKGDSSILDQVVHISTTDGITPREGYSNTSTYTYTFKINSNFYLFGIYVEKYTDLQVENIALSKSSSIILEGEQMALYATLAPANATIKSVVWESSNTEVATVTAEGLVTAVTPGTAIITVTAQDGSGVYATCAVSVKNCDEFEGTIYSMHPSAIKQTNIPASGKIDVTEFATIENGGSIWLGNATEAEMHRMYNNFGETSEGSGEYQWWLNSDDAYMQLNLKCALRNGDTLVYTSGSVRELAITTTTTRSTAYKTSSCKYVVTEGDGLEGAETIYLWRVSSSGAERVRSIEIHRPETHYTRTHTHMNLNTLCFPYTVTAYTGGTFYTMLYKRMEGSVPVEVALVEHEGNLIAGNPYFYMPEGSQLELTYSGQRDETPNTINGVVGCYAHETPVPSGNYVTYNGEIRAVGSNVKLAEYRAYINMDAVDDESNAPALAPGKKLLRIRNADAPQSPTAIDEIVNKQSSNHKFIKDGQLFILRDGKIYNAMGQMIK